MAMISGLVSMPIMTRILPKEEYGMMVLINTTIMLTALIAGLGIQDAVTRLYSTYATADHGATETGDRISRFRDTVLTFSISISGGAAFLLIVGTYVAGFFIEQGPLIICLQVAAILVVPRAAIDLYLTFYRVEERPASYAVTLTLQNYLSVFFAVLFSLYLFKGLFGVYIGILLGEGLVAVLFLFSLFREKLIKKPEWDLSMIHSVVQYGAPLLIGNISMLVISSGNRYVIQYYLGLEAVANYSIPYQLALYVVTVLFTPVRQMFFPYIFSIYETKGVEETGKTISRAMEYLLILTIPAAFGLFAVGPDLITLLASEKYTAFAYLLPPLILGLFTYGVHNAILGSIPLLFKKTGLVSLLTCAAGVLNLLLNFLFIPFWGLWGAALAIVFPYLFMCVGIYWMTRSHIRIAIDWIIILKAVLFSFLMLVGIGAMGNPPWPLLFVIIAKCLAGGLVYGLLCIIFDANIRQIVYTFINKNKMEEKT